MEQGAYTESRKHWGCCALVRQGTTKAAGSGQKGKVNLSSGSPQRSPGKVSWGCSIPLHAAMPTTTEESQTNITEKKKKYKKGTGKRTPTLAALFSKKSEHRGKQERSQPGSLQLWTLVHQQPRWMKQVCVCLRVGREREWRMGRNITLRRRLQPARRGLVAVVAPTTDNNYGRGRARRRRGKVAQGREAKSCSSTFSKIMKSTPRTGAALPAPARAGAPARRQATVPPLPGAKVGGRRGGDGRGSPEPLGAAQRRASPRSQGGGHPGTGRGRGCPGGAPRGPAAPSSTTTTSGARSSGQRISTPAAAAFVPAGREEDGSGPLRASIWGVGGGNTPKIGEKEHSGEEEEAGAAPGCPLTELPEPG